MRAAVFHAPWNIQVEHRPDPVILTSTDVIVRVTATCVCGSDLWYFRGESPRAAGQAIGHEFMGVVEEVGDDVHRFAVGDYVVAPFRWSDGACPHCRFGLPTACTNGGIWGQPGADGGQGEALRVPFADSTLVGLPADAAQDHAMVPHLLALSDVMGTGHHAAVCADVRPGSSVAVVGDGAVGLCGVLAAARLGAGRIIALSRHQDRQQLALQFGASDIVADRGADAREAILSRTDGVGVDAVLECVGSAQAMVTAFDIVRPGGAIGFVGLPHGIEFDVGHMFGRGIGIRGGLAPVRQYLPELLVDVLDGTITPGRVFDLEVQFEDIPAAYDAMHHREAIKALCRL